MALYDQKTNRNTTWGGAPVKDLGEKSGVLTIDVTLADVYIVTLTGNASISDIKGAKLGQTYLLIVKQDAVGGHTLSWDSNFAGTAGTPPVLTPAANAKDYFFIVIESDTVFGVSQTPDIQNFPALP